MTDEEKKDLIKKLGYCEQEYEQNGYLSIGKFNAIKQAIEVIEKQSKEIEELKEIKFENERTIELFIEGYKRIYKELDIKSLVMNENILINEIKENFTSKDKIKAKIEEINKEMLNEENSLELFYRKKYCKEVLQSLLERE